MSLNKIVQYDNFEERDRNHEEADTSSMKNPEGWVGQSLAD